MKVLVTAFKPFNKAINNYSIEVLKYINNVEKAIIDVVYDECFYDLKRDFKLEEYDLIIALGEARSRENITLEIQAVNSSTCSIPDNKGIYKINEVILEGLPNTLQTKLNLECCKELVYFSFDAGKFVCNNLYYHLLSEYPEKSVFIHVPNCKDSEEEYQIKALKIEEIIRRLYESSCK